MWFFVVVVVVLFICLFCSSVLLCFVLRFQKLQSWHQLYMCSCVRCGAVKHVLGSRDAIFWWFADFHSKNKKGSFKTKQL